MTTATTHELTLTSDQLRAMTICDGTPELPVVLVGGARYGLDDRRDARDAALNRATRDLVSRRLIVGGKLHPDLLPVLQALQRPDRELAMRVVTPDGTARISVMRRATLTVLARRTGDDVTLRIIGQSAAFREVIAALLAQLPSGRPADVPSVGAPLQQMAERLSGTHDAAALADRIRALGADQRAAIRLGSALASREAFAEIVYSALDEAVGRICRCPAAVAVFFTKRGRIVAAPNASPSGELWSTLKPGTEQAISHAIDQLLQLSNEGWAPANGIPS
jgi:EspG family